MIGDLVGFFSLLFYIILMLFYFGLITPLPISDTGTVRYRTLPVMTLALILINGCVFIFWQAQDMYPEVTFAAYEKIYTYGFRGTTLAHGLGIGGFVGITSLFMHGDLWHLLGNLFYLWTFGRRIEDACGSWRYLLFYLVAGMVANVGAELLNPAGADVPGIGASGAIAGLMGASLLLFPTTKVECIWGIGMVLRVPVAAVRRTLGQNVPLWRWTVSLPSWLLLIYFAISNLLPSLQALVGGETITGVNTLAHIMGFVASLLVLLFVRKDLFRRFFSPRDV